MARPIAVVICIAGGFSSIQNPARAHVPHDAVQAVTLSPAFSQDNIVFAIVRGALFGSHDRGESWHRLSKGLFCSGRLSALAISPAFLQDRTIFSACPNQGVFRSVDAGYSWQPVSDGIADLTVTQLAISPGFETDRTLLALGENGQLHTTNSAGQRWHTVTGDSTGVTAIVWRENLLLIGNRSGKLYSSPDGGTTWHRYSELPVQQKITSMAILPATSSARIVAIGTEGYGLYKNTIQGETSVPVGAGMQDRHITSLASTLNPHASILFASTWHTAMLRSEDEGETWQRNDSGLCRTEQADRYHEPHFAHIAVAGDNTVFLGGFCGLFRSDNNGQSWQKLEVTLHLVAAIDISPLTDEGHTLGVATYGGGAYASEDGGKTWEINNRGLYSPRVGPLVYSPAYAEDKTVFTATYGLVLKSTDAGRSWKRIPLEDRYTRAKRRLSRHPSAKKLLKVLGFEMPPEFVIPLQFSISPDFATDQTLFVGMDRMGILRSVDSGESYDHVFSASNHPVNSIAVSPAFAEDQTLYAFLGDALYRSQDRGERWQRLAPELRASVVAISPNFSHDATLYAGGSAGLYRSRDRGETWTQLPLADRGAPSAIADIAVSPEYSTDGELLVQIRSGALYKCRDSAAGFEAIPSMNTTKPYEFSHVIQRERGKLIKYSPDYANDHTVYAAAFDRVLKSNDGGTTWIETPRPLRYDAEAALLDWFFMPIEKKGQWQRSGDEIYAESPHSAVTLKFFGTNVRWIGSRGPEGGFANVFVDGQLQTSVDLYRENTESGLILFTINGLPAGLHSVTIHVDETKHEKSSGNTVYIDAFEVLP